jgi:hypothetical protein
MKRQPKRAAVINAVVSLFVDANIARERELVQDLGAVLDELARFHRASHDRCAAKVGAS